MLYIVGYVKQNCWVYIAIGFITQLKRKKTNYLKHVRALHISWASVIVQLPYSQISKLLGYIFCSNLFFACRKQFPQYAGGRMLPSKPKSSKSFWRPKHAWNATFCCLAEPSRKTPATAMLEVLIKAKLGGKRICFGNKKGDHVYVLSRLEE